MSQNLTILVLLVQVTHKLPPDRRSYVESRGRVVRHTLALLLTGSAAQAAGLAYAQPGERTAAHAAALALAALANVCTTASAAAA